MGGSAVLAVEDSGRGIPPGGDPARLRAVLSLGPSPPRGMPGVGLGLAVVHRIAVAFGGSVDVRSEPGRGCRVEVRFPTLPGEREDGGP